MKQNITAKEINKLSDKARQRLLSWAVGHLYLTKQEPYLTIGQMIEFLDNDRSFGLTDDTWYERVTKPPYENEYYNLPSAEELCDALWEAAKQVLEK